MALRKKTDAKDPGSQRNAEFADRPGIAGARGTRSIGDHDESLRVVDDSL